MCVWYTKDVQYTGRCSVHQGVCNQYIEGTCWVHKRDLMSTMEDTKVSVGRWFITPFISYRNSFVLNTLQRTHGITQVYSWCPSNVLNIPQCNHNIPQCNHNIPQCNHNIPQCNHNIPQCNHNIPPVYSSCPSSLFLMSLQFIPHVPPVYSSCPSSLFLMSLQCAEDIPLMYWLHPPIEQDTLQCTAHPVYLTLILWNRPIYIILKP